MHTAITKPSLRLTDVSSHLVDFAITTYGVAPSALAAHLPAGFSPDVYATRDGRESAFVSAVTFVNTQFFVGFAPFVRLQCHQTNYRAYVRRGTERCVWFFGTSLGSRFVFVPRILWKLPWARSRAHSHGEWVGDSLRQLEWTAESELGTERLRARGTGTPLGRLDGFRDAAETAEVLTHPMVGYLRRRDGRVATYGVWHAPLVMEHADADDTRFTYFERLGLTAPEQPPTSVLVQRITHYLVFLPPRLV